MQMQHLMVGYPKYYQTADYALRLSVMADIATMRMKLCTSGINTIFLQRLKPLAYPAARLTGGVSY